MSSHQPVQLPLPGFSPVSLFADSHGYDLVSCIYVHMLFDEVCMLTPIGIAIATEALHSWDIRSRFEFIELVTDGMNPMQSAEAQARASRRIVERKAE